MQGWKRGAVAAAIAVGLVCGHGAPAAARDLTAEALKLGPAAIEDRRAQLFQQMLNEPTNLDIAFEYATLSSEVGDFEAAISTLERMLIYSPDLPRLQLELGVLYYRLGSYDLARAYFEKALASPATPPEVRSKIEAFLRRIEVEADPPAFSANLFSAIRWQSNATSAPASETITLNGLSFTLDEEATSKSDFSVLNIGTLHYVHNLRTQGVRLEADVLGYSARYFEQDQVNLEFLEAWAGPSFDMKRFRMEKTRAWVYAIGDAAQLEDDYYFSSIGGGIRLATFYFDRSIIELKGESRYRTYNDTFDRPFSSLREGPQSRLSFAYAYQLTPALLLTSQHQVQREDTDADFYSNFEYASTMGLTYSFAGPFRRLPYPWALQIGGGYIFRDFDDPDPTINIREAEEDEIFWGRAALIVPVTETLALVPQVEYRDQSSNYDIRDFDSFTALVGLNKRF